MHAVPSTPLVSVIPLWNEEGGIEPLLDRLTKLVDCRGEDWEFVFVDDGSTDGSADNFAPISTACRLGSSSSSVGTSRSRPGDDSRAQSWRHPCHYLPAFQALWSDWDVALHHHRRYRAGLLHGTLEEASLKILHLHCINVLAFPAVFLFRKIRAAFPSKGAGSRAEKRIPAGWLNRRLQKAFVSLAYQDTIKFLFGVGLLAVARRRR